MLIAYDKIVSVKYSLKQEYTNVIYQTHRITFWLNRKVKCKEGWYENYLCGEYIEDILNYIPKECYIEGHKVYYLPYLVIKDITGELNKIYFKDSNKLLSVYNELQTTAFFYKTDEKVEQNLKK